MSETGFHDFENEFQFQLLRIVAAGQPVNAWNHEPQ